MVDILHNPVDGAGQLAALVHLPKGRQMASVIVPFQRVLNVLRNRAVHVLLRRFLAGKCRLAVIKQPASAHRPAVPDVLIDAVHAEHALKFAVRNVRRVNHLAPVIQLLILRKRKPQRVRPAQNNLHPVRRVHIRKQRGSLQKILHQRDFIKENVPNAIALQLLHRPVDMRHPTPRQHLHNRCLFAHLLAQIPDDLPNHRRLPGPAEPAQNQHPLRLLIEDKCPQPLVAPSLLPSLHFLRIRPKPLSAAHHQRQRTKPRPKLRCVTVLRHPVRPKELRRIIFPMRHSFLNRKSLRIIRRKP